MNEQSRPEAAPQNTPPTVDAAPVARDMVRERAMLAGPLDGRASVGGTSGTERFLDATQHRLSAHGGWIVGGDGRTLLALVDRMAVACLDVAGWAAVAQCLHPDLPASTRQGIAAAVWRAAQGWHALDGAHARLTPSARPGPGTGAR